MDDSHRRRQRMIGLLRGMARDEGYTLTCLPDVRLLRADRPLSRTPVLYEPGIVIVVQGSKRGFLGRQTFVYDDQHYLVVSVPVPFTMETQATAQEPLLAIYLRLDSAMALDLCEQLDRHEGIATAEPRGLYSSPMEASLSMAVLRLLEALANAPEGELLGPAMVREIYFRVLCGAQGGSMRAALAQQGRFGRGGARDPFDPQRVRRGPQRRSPGRRGGDERADVSCPFSRDDRHVADALRAIDPATPGEAAHASPGHDGRGGRDRCRLRKRLAVQS